MKEMNKNSSNENTKSNTAAIIICNAIFTVIATIIILVFVHSKNQNILAEIEELKLGISKK